MAESGAAEGDFKDYCERFAAYLEKLGRSPLTIKNYRSDLRAFEQWLKTSEQAQLHFIKVSSIEMRQYQEFLLKLQKLSHSSVNRRMGALKNFYTWLKKTEALADEPCLHMPAPLREVPVEKVAFLSQAEQLRLLKAAQQDQDHRNSAIIRLLFYTGVRVGELCQLRWADIELEAERGQLLVRRREKSWRDRKLMLSPEACAALLDLGYQAQAGSQALVFIGQRGGMTPRGMQDVVRKYGQRTGLKKLTPQMLRHTYAIRMLEQGVPLNIVADHLGASAQMLLHYYDTLSPVQEVPLSAFLDIFHP